MSWYWRRGVGAVLAAIVAGSITLGTEDLVAARM